MKSRSVATLAAVGIAVLALSFSAFAQSAGREIVTQVPFEFGAGDKTFPAGTYKIVHRPGGMPELQLRSEDGKNNASLVPITRLARQHMGDAPKASLVFDTVGTQRFLSEVWLPGQDGFLVRETKDTHEHAVVETK